MQQIFRVSETEQPDASALLGMADVLSAGGLVLLPTETVYGIGVSVSAYSKQADLPEPTTGYHRIFKLKQRALTQTVPWLVEDVGSLDVYGRDVPDALYRVAERFWPGALTIVVKASSAVPQFMQAADGTVALRSSASPVIQAVIHAAHTPLALTSANTHGAPAPCAFDEVEPRILAGVDAVIDAGATTCRQASTIVSYQAGALRILREGPLSACDLGCSKEVC